MSSDYSDSIVLITSSDRDRSRNFGTGFVIHRDGETVYLLTCAHVVRDVGGKEQVAAGGIPATVVAAGDTVGFDLAVLQVQGLRDKPHLSLRASGEAEKPFIIAGFYQIDPKTPPALRPIHGILGDRIRLSSIDGGDRVNAWDLKIEVDYYLQPGYSGSPVSDRSNNCVLGVVTHQIGKGDKGLAISIEALAKIWPEMPYSLITQSSPQQPNPHTASTVSFVIDSAPTIIAGSGRTNYTEAPNQTRSVVINLSSSPQPTPVLDSVKQRKCQDLRKQLDDAVELQKDYQQDRRLTNDPKVRQTAKIELERLQKEIDSYEKEMNDLGC